MQKIHTRRKRKFGLTTSFRHRFLFSSVMKKFGAKTFKTEEAAHAYAKAHDIKDYTLNNLKSPDASTKKIRIETA